MHAESTCVGQRCQTLLWLITTLSILATIVTTKSTHINHYTYHTYIRSHRLHYPIKHVYSSHFSLLDPCASSFSSSPASSSICLCVLNVVHQRKRERPTTLQTETLRLESLARTAEVDREGSESNEYETRNSCLRCILKAYVMADIVSQSMLVLHSTPNKLVSDENLTRCNLLQLTWNRCSQIAEMLAASIDQKQHCGRLVVMTTRTHVSVQNLLLNVEHV